MKFRSLVLVFAVFCLFGFTQNSKAQNNCIAIAINEYCPANIPSNGLPDAFGELSDWVELKCNFSGSVSLASYYLSNDRNNLFKWKFPADFVMTPGTIRLIWLSGRNTVVTTSGGKEVHAGFTLEQCKQQWIILSNGAGVVQDSVYVRSAMGGHSWGRIDCFTTGAGAFMLYTDAAKTPGAENGSINNLGYCPTPRMVNSIDVNQSVTKSYEGGFYPSGAELLYFELEGQIYDTTGTCFDIFYTEDGSYPVPGYPPVAPTSRYSNSDNPVTLEKTKMIRAISVPKPRPICSAYAKFLPSFCESNTYFLDPTHQDFSKDFGVVSVAMDENWFAANGSYASTVHVEYYDKEKQVTEGYGIIDRPISETWVAKQKGFNISIDDRFGRGCNFQGPIFNVDGLGASTRTFFPTLHLKGGDFESASQLSTISTQTSYGTAIRDVFIQSLAIKYNLNVGALHIKPVIGFINGKYSGVYDLREVFDKYYENFYNGQSLDSLDLNIVQAGQETNVKYWDNSFSTTPYNNFRTEVYDVIMNNPMNGATNAKYLGAMSKLDKASYIDYMILNSYTQNQDLFKYNVAFARGYDETKPGSKWHYYLYNMPSTFNFSVYTNPGSNSYLNAGASPCYIHNIITPILPKAYDGHSNMLTQLMGKTPNKPSWGNTGFQREYISRYLDLLNGPFKCENLLGHYDYVVGLFAKEMRCHEDPGCEIENDFSTQPANWDSATAKLRLTLEDRCFAIETQFSKTGCYGLTGPYEVAVDVRPAGAGNVKVNSLLLDTYVWKAKYYQHNMTLMAYPTNTNYAFHHWEIVGPDTRDPLSADSIGLNFSIGGEIVAVFTDKQNELTSNGDGANIPTGFSPNGDGLNDLFRPLGAGSFADQYQISIFNRWGQEVFRATDPAEGWDGNYKGGQALTGVYAYVITYKSTTGEAKVVKGNVTLTR